MCCVHVIALQVAPRFGSLVISSHYLLRKKKTQKTKVMGNFQRERKIYKTKTFELMRQYVHFVSTWKNQALTIYKVGYAILRI